MSFLRFSSGFRTRFSPIAEEDLTFKLLCPKFVFMPKFTDPNKRYRIRHEANRKSKQYIVVFTKRWADTKDPNNGSPELRKKKSFSTLKEAKSWANHLSDQVDRSHGVIDSLPLSVQTQIIGLCSQLRESGYNPVELLQEALKTASTSVCPIDAITHGSTLVEVGEDFKDKKIGYFIDLYESDPKNSSSKKHRETMSNIKNNLSGLRDLEVGILVNVKKARQEIRPILQAYCERPDVKRLNSLILQRSRLRQVLNYIRTKTESFPTKTDIDDITDFDMLNLNHNLTEARDDYALAPEETLVLMKWFFREKSFCPYYPILAALMGSRYELFTELTWKHFGGRGKIARSTVKIPRDLLKTFRQGKATKTISFKISDIPNLEIWMWYALKVEKDLGFKRHGKLPQDSIRTISTKKIHAARQECLKEWKHCFECEVEEGEEFNWANACGNGFRNGFITFGNRHPVVRKNISNIANDSKSHDHYTDPDKSEAEEQAAVLFDMNPMYLNLVDLEKKTVDTKFLYANLETKQTLWKQEADLYKKEAYRRILESHGIFPNPRSFGAQIERNNKEQGKDLLEPVIRDQVKENEFWQNVSGDKMLYMIYSEEPKDYVDRTLENFTNHPELKNLPSEDKNVF